MKKTSRLSLFVLLFFSVFIKVKAQQIIAKQDFGVWVGVALKKELPSNFEISLEQQLRTCLNTTRIDNYWAELGLTYTINKNFRLNSNARYIHDVNKWKAAENSLRYNLDIEFRAKVKKKFQLFYRLRYQQKFINLLQRQRTPIAQRRSAVRNKIRGSFQYKKVHKFYFSTELFVTSEVFREAYLDKLRFCIGDKIKTNVGSFNCAVGYEVNVQVNDPFSFFFLKIVYSIKL
ncbi:DUF2490 domain-containing protein [Aureispira anguillae]|uniref:DUF2490 domain-containing protein n=1 Tax=Aureispira anguillae TaxID=2864201 RepID=A0A915YE81_9BACT|nr:DUF2490 domain-containing protein [Aureispira anguillae]BDS11434.1 DUF2490 domain-containing protein [Aureispira anguillae]